jgi:hypothetical protein
MPCPTPEKIPHRSKYAAIVARDELERVKGIDLGLKPYPCNGHWHLGHRHKPTPSAWTRRHQHNKKRRRRNR